MAYLYSMEDLQSPVVEELHQLGDNVLTIQETGKANQAVADDLQFAIEQKRAVLTVNRRHFIRLHQTEPHHAGIIVCSYDPDLVGQARRIHEAIEEVGQRSGELIRVDRPPK